MYGIYAGGKVIAGFIAPISVVSNVPVFAVDSLSLKRHSSKRPAQRWEITTALEPLSFGANKLFSLFVRQGHSDTIDVTMPQNYGAVKALTSNSTPTATGSAGASSVSLSNNNGIIPDGTFIKFANHSKIYMVAADVIGNAQMFIFPTLRIDVTAVAFTYRDDVIMTSILDTDTVTGMSYTDGILMELGTVKILENL